MDPERRIPVPTYPGWPVILGFLVVGAILLELAASAFSQPNLQWTPALCVALLGITVVPPWLALRARGSLPSSATHATDSVAARIEQAVRTSAFPEGGEILDGRITYPEFLYPADKAQIIVFPSGESFLAARFRHPEAALEAARGYTRFFGMSLGGITDQTANRWVWKGPRQQARDFAFMRRDGNLLLVWTARDLRRLECHLQEA